jgi:hypothetical protein
MHQNKFHTERIQELTIKYQASTRGGPQLSEDEQKLADHLKILYKFANKGIKGRGKKDAESKPTKTVTNATTTTTTTTTGQQQDSTTTARTEEPAMESRVFTGEQLLPLPVSKPLLRSGMEGNPPFMGWSRGEDVFVGNQGGSSSVVQQSNNFLGIPGDGGNNTGGGLGGYAFGNMG